MKFLKNISDRFFMKPPILHLGRWNIVYCSQKINRKIDLSNEDHCGPCGQHTAITPPREIVVKKPGPIIVYPTTKK